MTSSRKIDVDVKENGHEIGYRTNCPVRKLPNSTAGVVVRGLVYSLLKDHSIDLAEEGTATVECPEFFRPDEDLVYADAVEVEDWWFFEKTRWRSYLAFDGSEAFAGRLNAAFEEEGLSDGYAESFRPAKNGQFYDYFIRLSSNVDDVNVRRIIGEVSEKEHGLDFDEAAAKVVKMLIEHHGGPRNFVTQWADTVNANSRLEQEVEGLRDSGRRQRGELDAINAELLEEQKARRRLGAQIESLRSELIASTGTARSAEVSWDELKSKEIDRLTNEVTSLREEKDLLELEVEDLTAEVTKASERVRSLEAELEIKKAEQRSTEVLPFERVPSSRKEKQILHDFLSGAFPRLELQDPDLKALLRDFGSISCCAKVMCDLQEGRDPPHLKSWRDMKGVFEVSNVGTGIKGRERMGRIYFKKSSESDKIDLAVQVKSGDGKQQDEFVKKRFR